jgi:hypothetical protein
LSHSRALAPFSGRKCRKTGRGARCD